MTSKIQRVLGRRLGGALVFLLLFLAGCTGSPPWGAWSHTPTPEQIAVVMGRRTETFIYFSRYEVYQNMRNREYVYWERQRWVHSPLPPATITAATLQQSPTVKLTLDDSPERAHAKIRLNYPSDAPTGLGAMTSLP